MNPELSGVFAILARTGFKSTYAIQAVRAASSNEACDLRDNYQSFLAKGYDVLGASADSAKRQQNWINKHELPFPLLADEDKAVIEAFGVWGPKKFMGKEYDGIHRTTFVIGENGKIEDIIVKVKTKAHAAQILD